jgi:amidophosphoribosyltransferase
MCGIIGIFNKDVNASAHVYEGLNHLQHRGQDSAGICNDKNICIKNYGLVKNIFEESDINSLESKMSIGHVRYATNPNYDESNIQPILRNDISICHNGNIINTDEIETITNIHNESDSAYILDLFVHILANNNYTYENIFEVCDVMIKTLKGSYSVIIMIKDFGIICLRDKFGIRPLIYGKNSTNFIISSESCAIELLGYHTIRDVYPGEIIVFENKQMPRFYRTKESKSYPCLFEYIYFSRNDSVIEEISVYESRYKLGYMLGEKIKKSNIYSNIDIIVPVPDTSMIFGLGLQDSLKLPLQNGFVKNNYIDRTFIMKDNLIINKNIKRKINGIKYVMMNKNVLIVDDSIVRGNTSSHIVQLAKASGAKNTYFASGSPRILYPNIYGIYIPSKEQLIAVNRTDEDISDIIGAKKVIFNDLYEVVNCLKQINPKIDGFETSMFNNIHHY